MFGTLATSISSCGFLLLAVGIIGFLKYGTDTAALITLNLPTENRVTQICQLMLAVAVFLSYVNQYYVVMEIAGPNIIEPFVCRSFYLFVEYIFRAVLNIIISKSYKYFCELTVYCF